ncbi:hypothetical protein DNTS_016020 [Danionella cerebrum]|uniref:Uncharacterized protein n=1 Tax=Danionella cerebrum TaxID=2873325 RepID=A0A553N5G4_9TELE|nr:hypothetical protein DNTS_016020 [Danionella translucida]
MKSTCSFLLYLSLLLSNGVFAEEAEKVSATMGEPLTLHTGVKIEKDDVIVWFSGQDNRLLAKLNGKADSAKIYRSDREPCDSLLVQRKQFDLQHQCI